MSWNELTLENGSVFLGVGMVEFGLERGRAQARLE